ncbi:hypothetical protein SAMN05216238_104179 [Lentibacillus persicus]|uniref:Hook-length control protein FliK n=1 Tax=Lentibacillus persicus TaxID=640948 RepID=A0A1I1VDR8_9BACI|nr:hypothetical protein [Lentibacillus persicus]SFD81019.1 hypothetical protein SAMN05216238_104179 [Lentibacillus persicus]
MNVWNLSENRVLPPAVSRSTQVLRPGQIIQGKITKIYPDQRAKVQLGIQSTVAQLEASLTVGGKYHFQVQPSEDVVNLRVIGNQLNNQSGSIIELLKQLGLKGTKANAGFVQTLINEDVLFNKEQLQQAFQLLNKNKYSQTSQNIVKTIIVAGLPVTESVYQALSVYNSNDMTQQIKSLLRLLNSNQKDTVLKQQLSSRLSHYVEGGKDLFLSSPKEQFLSHIYQVLRSVGFNYENQIFLNKGSDVQNSIKAMLLQLIQQSDGAVNERSRQLLHYLNGVQIQSVNETANAIQANLHIPGPKLGMDKDMQLEFFSHKTENGKIDPEHCRIVFYLTLNRLQETAIDMHIQKRAISLTIYNDQANVQKHAAELRPILKEGLESMNYKLSAITFKPLKENYGTSVHPVKSDAYKSSRGVDYRI